MVLIVILLGFLVGSFVTCVSFRLPQNIPFVQGRSFCPKCKKTISFSDNIPVISYLLLKGRCRKCHTKISPRYPLIELAMGALFGLFYLLYTNCSPGNYYFCSLFGGNILGFVFILITLTLLGIIFVTDLETQIIPDEIVFFGFILSVFVFLLANDHFFERLFSAFFVSLLLLFLHLVTKGRGMGLGDVKLALFGGLFFTFISALAWLMVSFIVGGVFGALLLAFGKTQLGSKIAFGPFMVVAFIILMILGNTGVFRLF